VLLFKAYSKLCAGVALVIANLATFLMYFINLALYPGQESFTRPKIILAIIFFVIITQFLMDQDTSCPLDHRHKHIFNPSTLYALGTAVCRAIYFVGNSYYIKSNIMSPVQSGMITETLILIVALVWFLSKHSRDGLMSIHNGISRHTAPLFLGIGILNVCAIYLMYYGYQTNPANIVNVIRLFAIPVTAIACWVFLKDRSSKKQTVLLVCGCVVMIGFMMT
jgi:drug/metabolite transporter (DMT)-like permease